MTTEQNWSTSDGNRERRGLGGSGCTTQNSGLPQHNPSPSTERGKRRHANRNEDQRRKAELAWGRERSRKVADK